MRTSKHACSNNIVVIIVIKAADFLWVCLQKALQALLAIASELEQPEGPLLAPPGHVREVLEALLTGSREDLPPKRLAVDHITQGFLHDDHKSLG